ncbi:MAG: ABC transporter ATP-binding protein [Gammaproteobacteria bacterium]|nr:ABC transporter ATP-binding protein [Gammaproteobacteria bacterium]
MTPHLLAMRGIEKRFGALRANAAVNLELAGGEVLGLLGENGAGKTTLMNVLFGIYSADAGRIEIQGAPVAISRPADALDAGIGMVHQHFHLVPRHSVLENLMVGEPGRSGRLHTRGARDRLLELARRYGLELDPDAIVGDLTVGEQQRLEIIKALFRGARILILDEPTSVLTPQQTESLFRAVRAMATDGVGIIFISHKLNEVLAITHRLTVMRRGAVVAEIDNDGSLTRQSLAEHMCGHPILPPDKQPLSPGRPLLELSGVGVDGSHGRIKALADINLAVHAGEIVGIAGVSGNGQRELAEVIAGVIPANRGTVVVDGKSVSAASARAMQDLGVTHIPEDRMGAGLLTTLPLLDSIMLPLAHRRPFSRFGLINRKAVRRFALEQIEKFDIRTEGPDVRTGTLSGGNLQKVLLARAMAFDPLVLVAAQPTRGLDVAAVEFVHDQFLKLRAEGRGVLLVSEDLDELFALSDRIVVMYEGRVVGNLDAAAATPAEVGLLMTGSRAA